MKMHIHQFKLIGFNSNHWEDEAFASSILNIDTKNKTENTVKIMKLLREKIAKNEIETPSESAIFFLTIKDSEKTIILLLCSIDYDENKVFFPNEGVNKAKLGKYHEIYKKYNLQINPILTFYKNGPSIKKVFGEIQKKAKKTELIINEIEYNIFAISDKKDVDLVKKHMIEINKIYIADGHHRFSIFSENKVRSIMIALTDSESICLKSCHRVIINPLPKNYLETLSDYCLITKIDKLADINYSFITMITREGNIFQLEFNRHILKAGQVHNIVEDIIFCKMFCIDKSEISNIAHPLPGNITTEDLEAIFESYENSSAVLFIPSMKIFDFLEVVDKGGVFPATSTWFEPKIMDGFISSSLD